jgi:NAD+ diphosphatase
MRARYNRLDKEIAIFVSRILPPGPVRGPAYWFIFQADRLLVWLDRDGPAVPRVDDPAELGLSAARRLYLGYLDDDPRQPVDCDCAEIAPDAALPAGMRAAGLRELYAVLGDELFAVAGRAVQLLAWDRTQQFCGQCGSLTVTLPSERAKRCPTCGLVTYPRISPAIIIAVVRHTEHGRQLLLARNHRFPPGRYSVVAGFVEPGESLEECAQREVLEEVGVHIDNIRYFGSQPWPFPNSLMIGFTADYVDGEVTPEESELADARWFSADALPDLPPKMTIARRLIDWFGKNGSRQPAEPE